MVSNESASPAQAIRRFESGARFDPFAIGGALPGRRLATRRGHREPGLGGGMRMSNIAGVEERPRSRWYGIQLTTPGHFRLSRSVYGE